jgi:hypothetical protein
MGYPARATGYRNAPEYSSQLGSVSSELRNRARWNGLSLLTTGPLWHGVAHWRCCR